MRKTILALQYDFDSGYHVGDGTSTDAVDAILARDGQGRLVVRGTSLAGVLRAEATRLASAIDPGTKGLCIKAEGESAALNDACRCPVCHLFGTANPGHHGSSHASRLVVHNAYPGPDSESSSTVIDRVAIDRDTGAALEHRKFNLEVGFSGPFVGLLELNDGSDEDCGLLGALLAELEAGRINLGGGSSGGLGWMRGRAIDVYELDLENLDTLCVYLQTETLLGAPPSLVPYKASIPLPAVPERSEPGSPSFVSITCRLAFSEYELINDPAEAVLNGTHGYHVEGCDGKPCLPGFSLRGSMRSHCERILRTMSLALACRELSSNGNEGRRACASVIRDLLENGHELSPRLVLENSCEACRLFGSVYAAGRIRVGNGQLIKEGSDARILDLVAIDRFTGGALDKAKYDLRPERKTTYEFELALRDPEEWMIGLVLLAIRDLTEGNLPIGGHTRKGFGQAEGEICNWIEGRVNPVQEAPSGATQDRNGIYTTWTWNGLPLKGSPGTFASAAADDLVEMQDRYLAPLMKMAESSVHGTAGNES